MASDLEHFKTRLREEVGPLGEWLAQHELTCTRSHRVGDGESEDEKYWWYHGYWAAMQDMLRLKLTRSGRRRH